MRGRFSAIALGLCLVGACGKDSGPEGKRGEGGPTVAHRSYLVLEVSEIQEDSFAEELESLRDDRDAAPFVVSDEGLTLSEAVASSTDVDVLARHGLSLGSPDTALEACRVLVLHSVRFAGKARTGDVVAYLARPSLPVSVALSAGPDAAAIDFEPAGEEPPLEVGLYAVRALSPGTNRLEIEAGEGDAVHVRLGDRRRVVEAGQSAELESAERLVRIREKALVSRGTWQDPGGPLPTPIVVSPERDHGDVRFRTVVRVRNRGRLVPDRREEDR